MVELVEPAKPTALEKLGEAEPALEVAVGWPRPKCDGAPVQVPEYPSPRIVRCVTHPRVGAAEIQAVGQSKGGALEDVGSVNRGGCEVAVIGAGA
jgi:hypothetical protein